MIKITASDVNNLRKSTGAGMMDCKNALVEAEGNFDKAVEILRKKGKRLQPRELTETQVKVLHWQLLIILMRLELELF
ncbi:MAG: hypothetical protein CM15mP129_02500 [Chloroflexota bacterium]|nr:MAG: hypothetical protein CM15mP129_02500 [Chloroflexota bacterium]